MGKVISRVGELFLEFLKMFCYFFLFFRFLICRVFFFAECFLSSVTLGKGFAECKIAFAECLKHSTKNAIPVVQPLDHTYLNV
jgi:hypothetical protein